MTRGTPGATIGRWTAAEARALQERGAAEGHPVTVTPIGPHHEVDCPCESYRRQRRASRMAATIAGLDHVERALR